MFKKNHEFNNAPLNKRCTERELSKSRGMGGVEIGGYLSPTEELVCLFARRSLDQEISIVHPMSSKRTLGHQ